MKRRYLVLLFTTFFMFLYIGPVNLLPYDVPFTIVQGSQEPTLQKVPSVVSTDISVVMASGDNDDWWRYNDATGWADYEDGTLLYVNEHAAAEDFALVRFSLAIPSGATIDSANLTLYEDDDSNAVKDATIRRVDESDPGPPEDDVVFPDINNDTWGVWDFDGVGPEWHTEDVTDIVQNQIDVDGWSSEDHICFVIDFNKSYEVAIWFKFDAFENADTKHSYMNISYTSDPVTPYGEEWLDGWGRRQQHNITQTAGTGDNYTVPIYVWNGLGSSWFDAGYTNGYAQNDFDDIRFTMNDGSTELEYQLNATWGSEVTDYISNDSEDNPAYPANYPNAVYYNQRTYITRHGPERDPFITYYDHENETWGGWYGIGDNSILYEADDGHGCPALFVDDAGYIHAFWGGHAAVVNIRHSKSDAPEDITSWSLVNEIEWAEYGSTYPHVIYDATNDLLHMYTRTSTAGAQRFIEYRNSTDKGVTWSNAWYILDMSDAAPYFTGAGTMDSTNTTLSLGFRKYNFTTGDNEDLFYLRANFSSKTVYNASGHSQGETVTDAELSNIRVYDSTTEDAWGIDVHVDEDDDPYLMWTSEKTVGSGSAFAMFTYWNGTGWNPIDNITECLSWVAGHDFIVHSSSSITAFISESAGASRNMTKFTWDGNTWTRDSVIVENGNRYPCYSTVPVNYNEEIQVTFGEYIPNDVNTKMWAYGTDGLIPYTWPEHALFYVRVIENLTETDATIYLYYGNSDVSTTHNVSMTIDTGNDPEHNGWGVEEEGSNNAPTNDQAPACVNLDDTDNLYAKYKEYQITANVSDGDGFADLQYLEISLYSNDRETLYWTVRFTEDTDTFSEQSDTSNMIELGTESSTNTSSGSTLNVTFHLTIHWNHADLTDTDIKQYVTDDHPVSNTNWTEVDYDVETRLDIYAGPVMDDGIGGSPSARGNINNIGGIVSRGSIIYLGSYPDYAYPPSDEVDVWVSCSDVAGSPWVDTDLEDLGEGYDGGYWNVSVDSDDEVGLDTYYIRVVLEGTGAEGADLLHTDHTSWYIADRIVVVITADDTDVLNGVQVNFTLSLVYDYDGTPVSGWLLNITNDGAIWFYFNAANASLCNDTDSSTTNIYTAATCTESTHGITAFVSNSESVEWSALLPTTTPITTFPTTTETGDGVFYELFLSLDMWGYLGPLGIVIIGYVLAKKDRGLGLIAFMVQCLIAAQYFALVAATPAYWWHIYIILFGGLFSCVIPLIDRS